MSSALAQCLKEADHYLKAAGRARREQDDVGMQDALGHIHDALRRARGIPRGDGHPDYYPTLAPEAFKAGADAEWDLVVKAIDAQLAAYTGEMALALSSFRTTIYGFYHRKAEGAAGTAAGALEEALQRFVEGAG